MDKENSMNENLNLVEILKYAPEGTKLWSPICGECELVKVVEKWQYPIKCKKSGEVTFWNFRGNGKYENYDDAECVLFPSKENRNWSTFKVPNKHKEFEPYQKVLVGTMVNNQCIWKRDIYLNYNENAKTHHTFYESMVPDSLIIPYDKHKDGKQVPTKYYTSSSLEIGNMPKFQVEQEENDEDKGIGNNG